MKPRILFMGTPDFAVPVLQRLLTDGYPVVGVVCQPDRPQGRHMKMTAPPVSIAAQSAGLPVLQPEKVRTPEFEQAVRALMPDMIVTAAYGRILPPNILAVPPLGCLNVHASLLPAYRGAAPIQWSIINGDPETGVTIMMMDAGMDTGDILLQRRIRITDEIDAGELSQALSCLGAEMLPEAIEGLLAGRLQPVPQDHALATSVPMMTRELGRIDWSQSAEKIHNLVRGTSPWPGASTWCGDKRVKVHKTKVCRDPSLIASAAGLEPGTICLCGEVISVVCGEGVIDLLEIQSESGKRLHCRDCAHNFRTGQMMGGAVQ